MPKYLEENEEMAKLSKFRRPTTLDREQLEYTVTKTLTYSVLIFAALGTCVSVAWMTAQQLKK